MQRWHGFHLMPSNAHLVPFAAHLDDAGSGGKHRLHGRPAQRHHHFWRNQLHLPMEERQAERHFLWRRRAIARRTPWHRIGDIDLGAVEPDGSQHPVQQLPRFADEGLALPVFLGAGGFPDQHDLGFGIAIGKDQLRRPQFEPAAVISAQNGLELFERLRASRQGPCLGRVSAQCRGRGSGWPFSACWCLRRHHGSPRRRALGKAVDRFLAHGDIHAGSAIPVEHADHVVVTEGSFLSHGPSYVTAASARPSRYRHYSRL